MTFASPLVIGKLMETAGAFALVYVAVRVARIEWAARVFYENPPPRNPDLREIRSDLKEVKEQRRERFGPREALLVSIGTILVAVGCLIYLVGLLREP